MEHCSEDQAGRHLAVLLEFLEELSEECTLDEE